MCSVCCLYSIFTKTLDKDPQERMFYQDQTSSLVTRLFLIDTSTIRYSTVTITSSISYTDIPYRYLSSSYLYRDLTISSI